MVYRPGIDTDRRRGPDKVLRAMNWMGVISWIMVFAMVTLLDSARPKTPTFYDRWTGQEVENTWDETKSLIAMIIMYAGLSMSMVGIYLNSKRKRRKSDHYRLHFMFLGAIYILGLLFLLLQKMLS
jgi:hypothetical protein